MIPLGLEIPDDLGHAVFFQELELLYPLSLHLLVRGEIDPLVELFKKLLERLVLLAELAVFLVLGR